MASSQEGEKTKLESGSEITKLESLLEKMQLKREKAELELEVEKVGWKTMEDRLKFVWDRITLTTERDYGGDRDMDRLELTEMRMRLKQERTKRESQLWGLELRQEKGKMEPTPEEMKLEREKAELESEVEKMEWEEMEDKLEFMWDRIMAERDYGGDRDIMELTKMRMRLEQWRRKMKPTPGKIQLIQEKAELKSEVEKVEGEKMEDKLEFMWDSIRYRDRMELTEMQMRCERERRKRECQLWGLELRREKGKMEATPVEMKLIREIAKLLEIELKSIKEKLQLEKMKFPRLASLPEEKKMRQKIKVPASSPEEKKMRQKIEVLASSPVEVELGEIENKILSLLKEVGVRVNYRKVKNELRKIRNYFEKVYLKLKRSPKTALQPRSQLLIVLGGRGRDGQSLGSVEGYIFHYRMWIDLPPMNTPRSFMSSALVGNLIVVSGGDIGATITDSIEILNLDERPLQWITSQARLPVPLSAHQMVAYQGKLIVIGGHDGNEGRTSDKIYEVLLTPPYSTRILCSLPQPRAWHGAELVDDKIFIFGGGRNPAVPNDQALMFNPLTNECSLKPALPYRVQGMATVRWWKKVFLLGGVNEREQELDDVIQYNIWSGETERLPRMRQNRGDCSAVIADSLLFSNEGYESIIALGSLNSSQNVDTFEFYNLVFVRSWNILPIPPTREAREFFAAVIPPVAFIFE